MRFRLLAALLFNLLVFASYGLGQTATQVVFLDFDSGNEHDLVYTDAMQEEIQEILEGYFRGFQVEFSTTQPSAGEFSTIVFNEGPGGQAEGNDFLNRNKSDDATVNLEPYNVPFASAVIVTANIAAHELGHLMGLLHDDMHGPIGAGVRPGIVLAFDPPYPGPTDSDISRSLANNDDSSRPEYAFPRWFTPRSAVKLAIAESDVVVAEIEDNDSMTQAQSLQLRNVRVPNNLLDGAFAGSGDFSYSAIVVSSSLNNFIDFQNDPVLDVDYFEFDVSDGDLLNIEIISESAPSIVSKVDGAAGTKLSILDSSGEFVDYYGTHAFNRRRESGVFGEPAIVDLIASASGKYFVKASVDDGDPFGFYELVIHRFNGILGDANDDGSFDFADIQPFIVALSSGQNTPKLDINLDGNVNFLDISGFVELLMGI